MRKYLPLILLGTILFTGCVNTGSLNPYYTPETVVQLPELDGPWFGVETDEQGQEERTPLEIQGARISFQDDDGTKHAGDLVFFKIDEVLYADIQLDKDEGDTEISTHQLFKVIPETGQMTFVPMNYTWLEDQIVSKEINLPYTKEAENEGTIFTATPEEWVDFIKANKDNAVVFLIDEQFVLKR